MGRVSRRAWAGVVAAGLTLAIAAPAVAQTDEDAAERAAREISAARERANDAAAAYLEAESKLALLQDERDRLGDEVVELEERVAEIRETVERVAVNRFMSSGATGIPILTDLRQPNEQMQAVVLTQVVSESGATTIDDFDAANEQLDRKREDLAESERALERSKADLLELQAAAEAEVERLREIESKRLEDEAVAAALAAEERDSQRRLEEFQRRQAEAARSASGQLGVAPPAAVSGAAGPTSGNLGASGGDAGGRTGGGGAGSNPRFAGDGVVVAIICPVQGGSAYGDSWGAPRSGGRRHQGVDMLAPTGTPLQAVVAGTVTQGTNRLGGITLSLLGVNGDRFYYAHLSGYAGVSGPVAQGDVIGFIGDTGNATGTPHLHFEIRPGGGVPVNPYPSVRAAGC